jgi:transcriptional regulator with XRE-family HTH domain
MNVTTKKSSFVPFLREVLRRRKRLPSQMASDLQISHATVIRWLAGTSIPSTQSCQRLSEYSGVPLSKILSLAGHAPAIAEAIPAEWPEFREYARQKYPDELDDDLITMIESLIERRRHRRYDAGNRRRGT